jgi:hypothetical protein
MNLSKNVKISQAVTVTAGAAGTTDIEGAILDMSGFEGVLVVVQMGAIVAGAVTSIKMQQDTAAAMGSAADLEGTSQTIAADDDEETFYIDLYRPLERYVRLKVLRATQNATLTATYYQYGARSLPVTHGSNVSGEQHSSPSEGTA